MSNSTINVKVNKDGLANYNVYIAEEENRKKEEEDPQLYTVAVTDMVFNLTIWIFERKMRTLDGHKVTQDYWFQRTTETKPQYWKNS